MKNVKEWAIECGMPIKDHPDVVVIGFNPAIHGSKGITSTFQRLITWFRMIHHPDFSFTNLMPNANSQPRMAEVDWEWFNEEIEPWRGKKVVALGNFVSHVLNKMELEHLKIPHPSTRNFVYNDWNNEIIVVQKLRAYIINDRNNRVL